LRTYLGPLFIAKFGRDNLMRTPGIVTECGEGLLIDVAERPWELDREQVAGAWNAAMTHLRSSGVFATPDASFTKWTKGPNSPVGRQAKGRL
jgi:hypothetical protein